MLQMKKRDFSGSKSQEISAREIHNRELARMIAEEGIVLLKNDGILPLDRQKPVGLFGSGAACTIKGGTGSGDVNCRDVVSVYQGMKKEGFLLSSEDWLKDFENRYQTARFKWRDLILELAAKEEASQFFYVYVANPFHVPRGRQISAGDLKDTDTAVYVISRNAGEGDDRTTEAGDYYLSETEKNELETLAGLCSNIVVLINSGAQIDMKYILEMKAVKGIINISQPGMEGGNAAAGVLSGRVTPCGKLTDTWAADYEDFPNADQFSYRNSDPEREIYSEGIYVGYRYFDAKQIKPVYPFGYGLSYTQFSISVEKIDICEGKTNVAVRVKNTGCEYSGKEVVQIYLSSPQKKRKEMKKLVAYAKTGLLDPGREQRLELSFEQKDYAYYCEEDSSWKIEKGEYIVLAGNSSDNLVPAGIVRAEETCVIEKAHPICPLQIEMEEWEPDVRPIERQRENWLWQAEKNGTEILVLKPFEEHSYVYRSQYEALAAEIVRQLSDEQLVMMSLGEISRGHEVALGSAGIMVPGAAGETSGCLETDYQIPGVSMADGPAGLRIMKEYKADIKNGNVYTHGLSGSMENGLFLAEDEEDLPGETKFYQYCTAFPVGVMVAQTWNEGIQEEFGKAVGTELQEMGISWWLAPGMNIHRNPLCGRNFEYFSEDPVVSGKTAAAITNGVQTVPGVGTTIKHFACNNAEQNRMASDSNISERALREIYLRGFEIAVKSSQPMAVMSSYNLINGTHTSESCDLLTTVLREEWGFGGIVMTDWTTTTAGGSTSWKVMAGGGNLIMPGSDEDIKNISMALKNGELPKEVLEERIRQLLIIIFQTNAYENSCSYRIQFEQEK